MIKKKRCLTCGKNLAIHHYYMATDKRDGRTYVAPHCKECSKKKTREWHRQNPEKYWVNQLKVKYKITLIEYNQLLVKQKGSCAICGTVDPTPNKHFSVDHNHKTGLVRGLLCTKCNMAIGGFLDKPESCLKAAKYLQGK